MSPAAAEDEYNVTKGFTLVVDPRLAGIVDGKLYLFVSDAGFQKYLANPEETLTTAEKVWPTIEHAAAECLR